MTSAKRTGYQLETVARACTLLRELNEDRKQLSFTEIVHRTGMEQTACFRLLRTLEHEGFLRRSGRHKYISNLRILTGKRFCIGYAAEGHGPFSMAVGQGLRWVANEHLVDLIELDNRYSQKTALRNAETLVKQNVDLVIESQVHERIAAELSILFQKAGIQ